MVEPADNVSEYRKNIEALRFGKRVGLYIYLHVDGVEELSGAFRSLVSFAIELADKQAFEFNIIKAGIRQVSLSLLNYPGFRRQAFPVLAQSAKLDLNTHHIKITDYSGRNNRPVLHRKELLLPPGHSHFHKFAALTAQAEEFGLLKDTTLIGLETGWRNALKSANVKIVGHTLALQGGDTNQPTACAPLVVERHKTAMRRQRLSLPIQAIQKYGYLNGDYSLFDYGCGRGDDLEQLEEMKVSAYGWDPHYRPGAKKKNADIVNLGFVINVIENRGERDATVRAAYELANKFLVASALIGNPDYSEQAQEMRDGVLTSIGTFQKYFLPDELENYIRGVLNAPVTSISQGVVLAFKSEEEADRFRARRVGTRQVGQRGSLRKVADMFLLDESARTTLAAYWDRCLELGREALASELPEADSLESLGLSPTTAFKFLVEKLGTEEIKKSSLERKGEMLVQFALGQFDGRVYYKYLAEDVQKDIDVFFGGFTRLQTQAKAVLFSIGDTVMLIKAAQEAASTGLGYILSGNALQLHVSLIDRLPAILRVYVGCALRLAGGLGRADLIKVHTESGKVSLMTYDDFYGQAIPHLIERIKVNLWARRTEYFDYIAGFVPPPLLMKSLFLPEDHEIFEEQAAFDSRLMKENIFDFANPHPTKSDLEARLAIKGFRVQGYDLVNKRR